MKRSGRAYIEEGLNVDVAEWWTNIFPVLVQKDDQSALAPVLRKIGEYAASENARRVLGQRRCTLNLEETLYSGKVLLVNSARSESGPEVAAIIGASILNLTEYIIRQQSRLSPENRQQVVVIVDEIQTLPGVRFDDMLAENAKYRGSVIMATQSMDRLNDLTENGSLRETLLSNLGCLVSFQVNASDARLLRDEMDGTGIDESDIMALMPHHCYGRVNLRTGTEHFSMALEAPSPAREGMHELIRQSSDAYTVSAAELDADHRRSMRDKFEILFNREPDESIKEFDQEKINEGGHGGT